jgi:hypothetical protein
MGQAGAAGIFWTSHQTKPPFCPGGAFTTSGPGAAAAARRRYNSGVLVDRADPRSWVLKALREAGNSLIAELHGLDSDLLTCRSPGTDLTLMETAAHLRDNEDLALKQLAAIYEGRNVLPAWDVDVLPLERNYNETGDISRFLSEFRALRRQTVELLWSASDAQWSATARHPFRGDLCFDDLAHELAQHDLEHLWQVRRLKSELGAAPGRSRAARPDDWW